MNYYLAQISVDNYISGKAVQVHMQVQYSLPTSYSATGLPSPGVVKDTALNLTSTRNSD